MRGSCTLVTALPWRSEAAPGTVQTTRLARAVMFFDLGLNPHAIRPV